MYYVCVCFDENNTLFGILHPTYYHTSLSFIPLASFESLEDAQFYLSFLRFQYSKSFGK